MLMNLSALVTKHRLLLGFIAVPVTGLFRLFVFFAALRIVGVVAGRSLSSW